MEQQVATIGPNAVITRKGPMPINYEAAKKALAECETVDQCKEWIDKAAAVEAYYLQSKDKDMEHRARRIRLRATVRAGELLNTLNGRPSFVGWPVKVTKSEREKAATATTSTATSTATTQRQLQVQRQLQLQRHRRLPDGGECVQGVGQQAGDDGAPCQGGGGEGWGG